jgi:hypothetical protein
VRVPRGVWVDQAVGVRFQVSDGTYGTHRTNERPDLRAMRDSPA